MPKITKNNRTKFSRQSLLPNPDGSKPYSIEAENRFRKMQELTDRAHRYYDSLQTVRDNGDRCDRYLSGDQLSDLVPNPNGCGMITEEQYIREQGMVPMAINIIAEPVRNIVGLYVRSHMEPLVISRDRDEQKLGEMMTAAMEYYYDTYNMQGMNARAYEDFLCRAVAAFRVGYDRYDDRNISDVKVSQCELNRMFWDENTSGMYFENITCIGYLHDMPLINVLSKFAKSADERKQIEYIYRDCKDAVGTEQQFLPDKRRNDISFLTPLNPEHCRVIEIWTKEFIEGEEDGHLFHDVAKGVEVLSHFRDDPDIIAENNRRIMEVVEAGGSPEEAALIEYEGYRCTPKWVVRYLTPNGYVLSESITPYAHNSHPFVIGAYPLRGGEIHSLVEQLINIQRAYNSSMMSNRYIRMNQAKGAGAVNKKILERSNVTKEDFATVYTDPSAIVELDWETGEEIFKPFVSNASALVDELTPQKCLEIMDKVSGNTGAIRGEAPKSGTPSSLYAQQAENSNNNIADMLEWFNGLIAKRDYKIMSVMQQFYKDRRYLNIAGKNYSEEAKWYDPDKVRASSFDLSLRESQTHGIFRAQNEQLLMMLMQNGMIDLQTYLEMSTTPFADKLLERVKAKQEEQAAAAQQQQMVQQQQMAQQPQQPPIA